MNIREDGITARPEPPSASGGDDGRVAAGRADRLLGAVVAAGPPLLAAVELQAGLQAALATLGRLSGHERTCVWQLVDGQRACVLLAEWCAPGTPGRLDTTTGLRIALADAPQAWTPLLAGESFQSVDADGVSPGRASGHPNDVMVPIQVADRCWGSIGLEAGEGPRRYGDAEIQALRGAAAAVAAAVARSDAEAQRLALERERTAEALALNALTRGVVRATRELLDRADFGAAVLQWLAELGRAAQADVAMLSTVTAADAAAVQLAEWQHAWRRDGRQPSYAPVPRSADFDAWHARLLEGQAVWADLEDLVDPVSVAYWRATDCATNLLVPVEVDGRVDYALCFDWRERHEHSAAAEAVLRTAAESLSAVLQRQKAAGALLAERESRLQAEQQRSAELARVNDALRQALDALAGTDDEAAFLRGVLVHLQCQTKARGAYLFRTDDGDGRLHLIGRAENGQFVERAAPGDPAFFTRGFQLTPAGRAMLRPLGRLVWRRINPATPITASTAESTRWHLAMGHQASAVQALMVGERQVGFLGLVFDSPEEPSAFELDLAHTLGHPLTLALELGRLSRLSQRGSEQAAMLKERNRLAREIHDGIAQAFLAIQMQLDPLGGKAQGLAPVQKALALARHGLSEARRAVAALRPQGLQNGDLPQAIAQLLAQADAPGTLDTSLVRPPAWQALPPTVEDHLLRIVQEAVTNVVRHARARTLRVELSQAAGETTVLVADDGIGFDPATATAQPGFGLESMQQRARLIGARIDWLSRPAQGTQVLVSWTSNPPPTGAPPAPPKAAG